MELLVAKRKRHGEELKRQHEGAFCLAQQK